MSASPILCLNMIIKNEMANLPRCLTAVADHIGCWVIGDTGSTDGTQDFIRSFFAERGIPGELHCFPFINFAQARNEVLERARTSSLEFDYTFFTDADMELNVADAASLQNLTAAAYQILQDSGVSYWNTRLLRRGVASSYKGVTHEFLDVREGKTLQLEGVSFIDHATGANRVDKYERDVRLLTEAIAAERDPSMNARYTFYLANTFRDSGQKEQALTTYLQRANLGIWDQEVFISLLNAASLKGSLGHTHEEVLSTYMEADAVCSTRGEALHDAARYCRNHSLFEQGYQYAKRGLMLKCPSNVLFNHDWIYEYGLLDEISILTYWTGRYEESVDVCVRLLLENKIPVSYRTRVQKNRDFAMEKMTQANIGESHKEYNLLLLGARRKESLSFPVKDILDIYISALSIDRDGIEAAHGAARLCRNNGMYETGYQIANSALKTLDEVNVANDEKWIQDYGLIDEFAINAYWTERYMECVVACDRLLLGQKLPPSQRERVEKNKWFALIKTGSVGAEKTRRENEIQPSNAITIVEAIVHESSWTPASPAAGTELMLSALNARIPNELERVELFLNAFPVGHQPRKPMILWMHHDINQNYVQWCHQRERVEQVSAFVFVSAWQMYRYQQTFEIDPAKCHVLRNSTVASRDIRIWRREPVTKFAYTSVPFRGLNILLDTWEKLTLPDAELHVWSSMRLYGGQDEPYRQLIQKARTLTGVIYHGIVPNHDLKAALRGIHFLTYPSTFEETSCLAVVDAMEAGCRIVVPARGALPETTAGFAHLYPWSPDPARHQELFAHAIQEELADPWGGRTDLSLLQQRFCSEIYDWDARESEWRTLIKCLVNCQPHQN